jgi:PAS domain-containing protein
MRLSDKDRRVLRELGKVQAARGFQSKFFWMGLGLTATLTASGIYLLCIRQLNHLDMSLLLFHILGGFPFVIPVVMFMKRHGNYARVIDKSSFNILGWVTNLSLLVALISGIWLVFRGISGVYWLWLSHVIVSLVGAAALTLYIAWILRIFKTALPSTDRAMRFYRMTTNRLGTRIVALFVASFVVTGVGAWAYIEPDKSIEVPDYDYSKEGDAFYPSRVQIEHEGFYNPEQFLGSEGCGISGCHSESLKQWQQSVHYLTPTPVFAAVQALFMEEARKGEFLMNRRKLVVEPERHLDSGEESFRFCGGCHTPVALMAGEIDIGEGLPSFEDREANSCIFCHRISSVGEISGGGGGDYKVAVPPNRYLFAFSDHPVGVWLNKTLINAKPEYHADMFMKPFYRDSEYCIGCHKRLQYSYWEQSPYNDEDTEDNKECQGCHMKYVETDNDVSAYSDGVIADHRTLGANLVTPMIYGLDEQYQATLDFMRDDNQELNLVVPNATAPGQTMHIAVRVINKGAGHIFPAGPEADLLEAWTEVIVTDANGTPIYEYGLLDDQNYLDHEATYVYNIRPFDKDGNMLELDRHRNWVFAEDRLHVIPAKFYDEHPFQIEIPEGTVGPLTVSTRLRFRKFNQEFLDFAAAAGFMDPIVAPVVDIHTLETTVALSADSATLAAAEEAYVQELTEPTGLEAYTKKPRFDDYLLSYKLALQDQIHLNEAKAFYAEEQFDEAMNAVIAMGPDNLKRPQVAQLLVTLEAAITEQGEQEFIKVDPFAGDDR